MHYPETPNTQFGCKMNFKKVNCEEFCSFLRPKKLLIDIMQLFREHEISGDVFSREADFHYVVPRVGDRVMLRNLQCHVIFSYLMLYVAIKMLF